jgi:predicted hydrocarbon binding protein
MFNIRKIQEQAIFAAVEAESNESIAQKIVSNEFEDNPTWVKNTMKRLENNFDVLTVKKIRMNCQCGYAMDEKFALVKELMASSTNLDEFANNEKAKAAGLSYHDGNLYLQFPFCPCPMLAEVDKIESNTWCQCTTGYSKVLFEKAFGCQVDVELLKSIKMGNDICLMKIIPLGIVCFD